MTPKEKAIEIFDRYWDISPYSFNINIPDYDGKDIEINHNQDSHAKICALICANEIIEALPYKMIFWQDVKKEIEKL